MSDLVPRDQDVLEEAAQLIADFPMLPLPWTGELVKLDDPVSVAEGAAAVDDMIGTLRDLRTLLTVLLRAESQRQGTKTLALGDRTVVLSGGERTEYDGAQLAAELEQAGLPADRLDAVVRAIVTWKVDGRAIKQLAAANPAYAAIIERHRSTVPERWRASIRR